MEQWRQCKTRRQHDCLRKKGYFWRKNGDKKEKRGKDKN